MALLRVSIGARREYARPKVSVQHMTVKGHVQNLQWSAEPSTRMNVCRFEVRRKNAQGQDLPVIRVVMRSLSFVGTLANGHAVKLEIDGPVGQLVTPKSIWNISANSEFRSSLGVKNQLAALPGPMGGFLALWTVMVGGLVLAFFIYMFVFHWSELGL